MFWRIIFAVVERGIVKYLTVPLMCLVASHVESLFSVRRESSSTTVRDSDGNGRRNRRFVLESICWSYYTERSPGRKISLQPREGGLTTLVKLEPIDCKHFRRRSQSPVMWVYDVLRQRQCISSEFKRSCRHDSLGQRRSSFLDASMDSRRKIAKVGQTRIRI